MPGDTRALPAVPPASDCPRHTRCGQKPVTLVSVSLSPVRRPLRKAAISSSSPAWAADPFRPGSGTPLLAICFHLTVLLTSPTRPRCWVPAHIPVPVPASQNALSARTRKLRAGHSPRRPPRARDSWAGAVPGQVPSVAGFTGLSPDVPRPRAWVGLQRVLLGRPRFLPHP